MTAVVVLLAPAILAALVVTETFATGRSLAIDERAAGLAAAAVAIWLRASLPVVVIVAAVAAAAVRAIAYGAAVRTPGPATARPRAAANRARAPRCGARSSSRPACRSARGR